jgi:transposase
MSVSVAELDKIINASRDAREVKRALCVKMALGALPVAQICEFLNVSQPFVSKWRGIHEAQGATALSVGYAGSQGYLTEAQKGEVIRWIQAQPVVTVAAVRDYLQEQHEVVYQSQQSYYDLLHAAGLSYHKSEKVNPQRDETLVQERREAIKKTVPALEGDRAG